ncbi:uncharacterized protein LOC109841436 [Asparagus officinalis]|uniref:uncharacterized protein LOC109841436 n=1 Tax=Asparagus officinalis TaxID=4686 RepID=UPI00098E617F|nr:uncharacterized protein LOC109841436 [Asparagus officinalis]
MMQLRFTSLLVGLLLALWVARGATSKVLAGNDQALGSVNELDDRSKTIVSIQSRKLKVGKVGELDVAQKEAKNGMNTGANLSSVRKCERGENKRVLSLGCVVMGSNRGLRPLVGLVVPFSSDYRAPQRHPPKHN